MHLGIWHEVTWQDYRQTVEDVALGMLELGVQEGDRVAMMGDPTPEWLYLDTAAMSIGAIFFGIYVNQSPAEMRYLLEDGAPALYMAQDQEYVDKLLDAEHGGQTLVEHVVVADMRGMFQYRDERLMSFIDLQALGAVRRAERPTEWAGHLQRRKPDDIIRISYTSGTTGRPKGAMLSSRNLVWATSALYHSIKVHPGEKDRTVSYMPPASPAEVTFSLILPPLYGTVPHIPDDLGARGDAFVEVSPTLLLAFPRMWETYASRALVDIDTGRRMKRWAYRAAFAISRRYYNSLWSGSRPGLLARFGRFVTYWSVFEHLLNKFGLARARFVMTGGAPVSPDLLRLWNTWGVGVQEIYGMTEVSGLATVQMDGRPMPGIAGKALYGMEVRLAPDGEILLKSPGVFHGYWRKDGATRDVVDGEGWLHTGDIGRLLPDGNLKVIDRRGDLVETSDGRQIAASEIEHMLKGSPYIREAVLTGDKREFLTVLIEIEVDAVSEWARAHRVLYTSFSSLVASQDIRRLISSVVDSVNVTLRTAGRPELRDYRILPKELDPEEGDEVTSTNKVRRRLLAKKFAALLDEMYVESLRGTGPDTDA
jgi:long-chain acyl-CoA synthetase